MVDFSKVFSRKTKLTKLLLFPFLLLAVSGCNNSTPSTPIENTSTTQPVTYSGKISPATITPQNQAKIYAIAQGETGQLGTSVAAGSINGGSSSNLFQAITSFTHIHYSIPNQSIASGAIVQTQEQGALGGTITWTGDISSSGAGWLKAVFVNYNNGGGALNGTVNYDIRASNINTGQFYDMTATFEVLEFSSKTAHIAQSGSFSILSSNTTTTYTETTTFNQDFTDLLANFQYRYENLTFTTVFNASDPSFATQADLSISGRIYEQSEGYIDINTNPPFHFDTLTQTNPSSGIIRIQGANGSLLQATAASETRTILALDTNGDGNFESTEVFAWDDEFGTPLTNNPPIIAGPTFLPLDIYTDTKVSLDGYTATDPDADNLSYTYEWKINGNLVPSATGTTLESSLFVKGDTISCTESVSDGITTVSATVNTTVLNSAPIVTLAPLSSSATRADTLTAQFNSVSDADGDTLTYSYIWKNNGVTIVGQIGSNLPLLPFNVNDVISVNATVSDGYSSLTLSANTAILPQPIITSYVTPAPATTPTNQALAFQVSASQADGYPITYSMAYGPDGMLIDAYGNVSWTPNEPMFATTLDVNYGVQIQALDLYAQVTGTIQITDNLRQQPIVRQGMRLPENEKSIYVKDMNNDGQNEVVIISTSNFGSSSIAQLRFDGINYIEDWVFPYEINPGNPINSSAVADINNDFKPEIIVTSKNTLAIIDGATREIINQVTTPQPYLLSTEIADLDGDGNKEIITLAGTSTFFSNAFTIQVYNSSTLTLIWESTQSNLGDALTIGNVDNDAALEIITSEGYVFDGVTQALEWNYGSPFGFTLDTGDLNADGIEEIVGAVDWTHIQVFSAISKVSTGTITPSWLDFSSLLVTNIDTDAYAEIIIGDGQFGNVTAYDGLSLNQQWAIGVQGHGTTSLSIGDADNDGQSEIIWGADVNSKLVVVGIDPYVNVEWNGHASSSQDSTPYASPSSKTILSSLSGGYLGTTAIGQNNVIFATPSTRSYNGGTRIISINPMTGNTTLSSELGSNANNKVSITVVDYDKDGIDEILLATSELYDAYYATYDFNADLLESHSPFYNSEPGLNIVHADMNGDGHEDIISLSENSYIYIWDAFAQNLIWKSTQVGIGAYDIAVADLNMDGLNEIIVFSRSLSFTSGLDEISVFQNTLGSYALRGLAKGISSSGFTQSGVIATGDINQDGFPDVIVGQNNKVYILNGKTLDIMHSYATNDTILDILFDQYVTTKPSLIISSDNKLIKVEAVSGNIIWSVDKILGAPQKNSVHLADTNGNGQNELMIGTSKAMYITR